LNIFENPEEWMEKWVPLAGEFAHPQDYAKQYSEVTGKKTKYVELDLEEYGKKGT
jgi:hypothetical protein